MKGWLQLNQLPPSVGLKPGTARSRSFSYMHLSGDAKDLLNKCTILTNILTTMMRRLTRVLFGHTFRK